MAKQAGFSLHAGVMAEPHQRDVLERLCRYISRPAVSEKRLALTSNRKVRYELKTPYRESLPRERSECIGHGTTHVFFDRGGVPPNSKHRALVTPAKRGKGRKPAERRKAMTCTLKEHREMQRYEKHVTNGSTVFPKPLPQVYHHDPSLISMLPKPHRHLTNQSGKK